MRHKIEPVNDSSEHGTEPAVVFSMCSRCFPLAIFYKEKKKFVLSCKSLKHVATCLLLKAFSSIAGNLKSKENLCSDLFFAFYFFVTFRSLIIFFSKKTLFLKKICHMYDIILLQITVKYLYYFNDWMDSYISSFILCLEI